VIDDGTIGAFDGVAGLGHLAATVAVSAPKAEWADEFQQLATRLRAVLGPQLLQIEHIGSTSVPGLAAKDVIDVQVLVATLDPADPIIEAFVRAGYTRRTGSWNQRDEPPAGTDDVAPGWDKLVFAPPATDRVGNVHVRRLGSANARQARLFRDHLRANPAIRDDWGRFKLAIAAHELSLAAYGRIKQPPTNILMRAAETWATTTRWEDPGHVRYRARTAADVAALAEVLAAQQPGSGYTLTWPLPVPIEQFIVRGRETGAWVAEVGGRAVGHVSTEGLADYDEDMLRCWADGAGVDAADLEGVSVLFVDGNLRGHGIGRALLDLAVEAIRARCRVPVLDVVHREGAAANLYRHLGWVEVGQASLSWLPEGHPPLLLMVLPPP
jgi:GrpB-like predicted nucleotidyltransferase (UPF0157 family)/GNAT superfamily N-acetyltransferase